MRYQVKIQPKDGTSLKLDSWQPTKEKAIARAEELKAQGEDAHAFELEFDCWTWDDIMSM